MENNYLAVSIDRMTGNIKSIYDKEKESQREVLGERGGYLKSSPFSGRSAESWPKKY